MLSEKKKAYFKDLLTAQLKDLIGQEKKTAESLSDLKEESPDFTDQATMESERDFSLNIRERNNRLIGKINDALERLKQGTFSICEECGETISENRLLVRPVTTLCIGCKKAEEADEKARGI